MVVGHAVVYARSEKRASGIGNAACDGLLAELFGRSSKRRRYAAGLRGGVVVVWGGICYYNCGLCAKPLYQHVAVNNRGTQKCFDDQVSERTDCRSDYSCD